MFKENKTLGYDQTNEVAKEVLGSKYSWKDSINCNGGVLAFCSRHGLLILNLTNTCSLIIT